MKNESLLDYVFERTIKSEFLALKNAQAKFVKMHYQNANLIGSKGFTNLMGKSYELGLDEFERTVKSLSTISDMGSEIVFDYTDKYSYSRIEKMMSRCGYLIYEHLSADEMEKLDTPSGFHFVLAVKKEHLK